MKGFTRTETRFSLCGLNCALCSMHLGGYCPGCGGGAGNQSCTIARCSLEHGGVPFCWQCPEYPCPHYEGFDDGDSFVPHRNRQKDITLAQGLGLEAYLIPHVKRKYKNNPEIKRTFPTGACRKTECGAANGLQMGAGTVCPRFGSAHRPVGSPGDTCEHAVGRERGRGRCGYSQGALRKTGDHQFTVCTKSGNAKSVPSLVVNRIMRGYRGHFSGLGRSQ